MTSNERGRRGGNSCSKGEYDSETHDGWVETEGNWKIDNGKECLGKVERWGGTLYLRIIAEQGELVHAKSALIMGISKGRQSPSVIDRSAQLGRWRTALAGAH